MWIFYVYTENVKSILFTTTATWRGVAFSREQSALSSEYKGLTKSVEASKILPSMDIL